MDILRNFFQRRKRQFRNFPIIIINANIPVKLLDVNRLGYLNADYVPKVKLPSTDELYSFVNPFKHFRDVEPPYPDDEIPNEVEEIPLLGIPLDDLEEFLANIPLQMQNWVHTQEQAALAAMEATVAELNAEINLEVEGTSMALTPNQQDSNPAEADAQDEADNEPADDSVNVHVQELVESTVSNVVAGYEEAQHYEGASALVEGEQALGDLVPLEREVGAGDDEVGAVAGVAEEPAVEATQEPLVEDIQEPSTSGMSGYATNSTQTDNNKADEE